MKNFALIIISLSVSSVLCAADSRPQVTVSGFKVNTFGSGLFRDSVERPSREVDLIIQQEIIAKDLQNLERFGVRIYRSGDDLMIYTTSSDKIIESSIKVVIQNVLSEKIGTTSYLSSFSINSNSNSFSGCSLRYEGFFCQYSKTNITLEKNWYESFEFALDSELERF